MSRFFQVSGDADAYSSSEEESLYGTSSENESRPVKDSKKFGNSDDSESESLSDSSSGSDSDSDSESEPESDSDSEDQPKSQFLRSQFLKGQGSDSDDSDDERVVVKSAKDKVLDEIVEDSNKIGSAKKGGDWVEALTVFDRVCKVQDKANKQYQTVPKEFVAAVHDLNQALASKEKKKLSPSQSKAQNTLRQRLKKISREYESRLESYIADPENYLAGTKSLTEAEASQKSTGPQAKTAPGAAPAAAAEELTSDTVFTTLLQVMESRGRKNADKGEQVDLLERQLKVAETAYQKISLLMMLIPLKFDLASTHTSRTVSGPEFALWEQIEADMRLLFEVLESQNEYFIIETAPEPEDIAAGPELVNGMRLISGSLPTFVERLDDEHAKIMAAFDPHTTEYMERLGDETRLTELVLRAQCHAELTLSKVNVEVETSESFCRLLSRRIEHIYYKPSSVVAATENAAWSRLPSQLNSKITPRPESSSAVDSLKLIDDLCKVLYAQTNTALRTKAILSLIYQLALADDYYKARDLMLMSHLQSQIHAAEPGTQVLFNRALVQVGLCAFRAGLINESLQCLQEICGTSRVKELLGQATARTLTADQPQLQTQAPDLLPYHMHINLELVECVFLTVSMLTEIPYLANSRVSVDSKKRTINRTFRRLLDVSARQVFNGPSETTRDCVIQAAKHLQQGDWRAALELVTAVKVWTLISPASDVRSKVFEMLEHKIKIAGLQTYLLTFCSMAYHSLSLEFLATDFQLDVSQVRRVLTKMIAQDEIPALLDSTSSFLVFKPEADTPKIESVALTLAEKAQAILERNERLLGDASSTY